MIPKLAWLLAEEAVEEHLESINETIWMQYEDEEKYYDRTKAAYELYTHSKSILHEKNESTGKYGWRLTDMGCEEWDDFIVSYIKKSGSVLDLRFAEIHARAGQPVGQFIQTAPRSYSI